MSPRSGPGRRLRRWLAAIVVLVAAGVFLLHEVRTSDLQSRYFAGRAAKLTYHLGDGPSDSLRFPVTGPFNQRRGFVQIPGIAASLGEQGFVVTRQARWSPELLRLADRDIPIVYREETQASLSLRDRNGTPLYSTAYPQRVFATYDDIPEVVVRALLFVENRELADTTHPYANPAVEWDRFARATFDHAVAKAAPGRRTSGGSTLATQIVKFRHSAQGRTASGREKLRQMEAASLRAYLDGRETRGRRREIVLEYVNSVPLAAAPAFGEVIGLGDGMWVWYDLDFDEATRALRSVSDGAVDPEAARALKYAVSLFVAQRRPTGYLLGDHAMLDRDTDAYLRLLTGAGIVSPALRDAALAQPLEFRTTPAVTPRPSYIERKAANAVRRRLRGLLGLPRLYDLDRIDLAAETTLDGPVQERLARVLTRLADPAYADSLKLIGPRLLDRSRTDGVVFSFTLYEATPEGNLLRLQADNVDQPFDVTSGARLDLGSTAKLRTLVHYLEVVTAMHDAGAGLDRAELTRRAAGAGDPLRKWGFAYLAGTRDTTLAAMLEAAMQRRYSASPAETFFTGGGAHTFVNFDRDENAGMYTVAEAFRLSVNLSFIRLMRDLVRYHQADVLAARPGLLTDRDDPARLEYLQRFADREGKEFLSGFYAAYRNVPPGPPRLERAAARARRSASALAAVYRTVRPEAPRDSMEVFLRTHLPQGTRMDLDRLYRESDPGSVHLDDLGYIARLDPLELWMVGYLETHPEATEAEVLRDGAGARQDGYRWLFRTRSLDKQNKRIRILLEEDAFREIQAAWARLGYPFATLTPSYATAIGSSGDRPSSLAELVGIVVNDGVRRPTRVLTRLRFGEGTPYDTELAYRGATSERVLPPEVARTVRAALIDVVEGGTGRRCAGAFHAADGSKIPVGGKTGTGDHRFERVQRGGRIVESRAISRSGTFVFLIGDRFFGNVTVVVEGSAAAQHAFTSSLPVQLLASLEPVLAPVLDAR